jgi:hypothetical protein
VALLCILQREDLCHGRTCARQHARVRRDHTGHARVTIAVHVALATCTISATRTLVSLAGSDKRNEIFAGRIFKPCVTAETRTGVLNKYIEYGRTSMAHHGTDTLHASNIDYLSLAPAVDRC